MKKHATIICILTMALLAVSCVKLGGKPLDKKFYRISPTRQSEPNEPQSDIVLKVRRITVSQLYDTRELVYQMDSGRIESDFYNMFFVQPGDMLTTELRKWLDATGQFAHIIEPGSMVIPTLTLEGAVNSLYGDYSSDDAAAVVAMQFFLVNENTATNEIIFSKNYERRVPLTQPDPNELVQAMNTAIQEIFTQLENDLAQANLNTPR